MTKLTKFDRAERKTLLAAHRDVFLFGFDDLGVTVGVRRTGEMMGEFAVSICADDESKFRRKVGEFEVLKRFAWGTTLPVYLGPKDAEWTSEGAVDEPLDAAASFIAEAVTSGR